MLCSEIIGVYYNDVYNVYVLLYLAIEYVNYLTVEKEKKDAEIAEMEKKLVALKIVKEYGVVPYVFTPIINQNSRYYFC